MELRGVDDVADFECLHRTARRPRQICGTRGKYGDRLLVAAEGVERLRRVSEQRIVTSVRGERHGHRADRLTEGAVDGCADDRAECADAVTASEERKVSVDDTVD